MAFTDEWASSGQQAFWLQNPVGAQAMNAAMDAYASAAGAGLVASLEQNAGSTAGGEEVVIRGSGFATSTGVQFGTTAATTVVVRSNNEIRCVTPAHAAGTVDVTILHPTANIVATGAYTYS